MAARQACIDSQIRLGWGFAMYPDLIAESLTIRQAAAPEPVLAFLLAALAAGSVILIPALLYLLRTFKGPLLSGRGTVRE